MDYCTGGKNLYKMMNGLDMKYELTLENDVIKRKSSYGEISFSWNKLKGINNTKKNILLFISERQAIIVPKRIFETKQELDDFWTIVQENYKNHTT
ncbi:YcxB family protein [bacterium]|nr:YcxB family protein [bacterium]